MSDRDKEAQGRARAILRGEEASFEELIALAKTLKRHNIFGLARRLFGLARHHPDLSRHPEKRRCLIQQTALCTYKDPDLPVGERFPRALEILEECEDLERTRDQKTLGLAGAIYKRLWGVDNQPSNLERSAAYYLRAYEAGVEKDLGYTAINAAFVLDLLAADEERQAQLAGGSSEAARARRERAREIREDIVKHLVPLEASESTNWWFFSTLSEALMGLGRYDEARHWLERAHALAQEVDDAGEPKVAAWERESTVRQIATLLQLHAPQQGRGPASAGAVEEEALGWDALRDLAGKSAPGFRGWFTGKVGLALSGGGFRASFFHLGVLAYLAERDVLRNVEVLSCVSGGSILGAHYYLEVKRLLEQRADADITREDYIAVVRRVMHAFRGGVQRNIRVRALTELTTNLRILWASLTGGEFSRSHRLGELYERLLYGRVGEDVGKQPRYMSDLFVQPLGEDGFRPKYDNWRRGARVPILVLNATTLNTGHPWQFTASWMGEPPAGIDREIDGNYRLRRMYYYEAPVDRRHNYRRIRLGWAVAASACVPGLFPPITFKRLFPARTVRLVDGGVHDNQGVSSLLEQDCNVIVVSDASGQMEAQDRPSGSIWGPPLRAMSILQARVRQEQFDELDARRRSGQLRGLLFLHLKKDLDSDPVDWVDCQDPQEASEDARPVRRRGVLTSYGIRKDVETRLAAIRTDLDSFSDAEAFALMTSGYRMAEHEFDRTIEGFPPPPEERPYWPFQKIERMMSRGRGFSRLLRVLDVGASLAFKAWRLSRLLQVVGVVLLAVVAAVILALLLWKWSSPVVALRVTGATIVLVVLTYLFGPTVAWVARTRDKLLELLGAVALSLVAWLLGFVHLRFIDRCYLRLGRLAVIRRQGLAGK